MPCVYLTINYYNKTHNINPYMYSGSDQNDNSQYYGSSVRLKADIKEYGIENFEKTLLHSFGTISNKDLREFESKLQIKEGHKKDLRYYNLTDTCLPGGGVKGMKHSKKFPRSQKWIDSMTGTEWSDESKEQRSASGNPMFGRKVKESTKELWKENGRGTGEKNAFYGKFGSEHPIAGYKHTNEECNNRSDRMKKRFSDTSEREHMSTKMSKDWIVIFPNGNEYKVNNLSKWCKENEFNYSTVSRQRKGWKCNQI